MIRAILALLFAVLYLILGIPVLFAEWIIRKCNRHAADISSLRMVQWAFRVIMFICGVKLTVIGVDRTDMKKGLKTILTGIDQIKAGISMCIFPEGTRNKTEDEMLPFKAGSLKLSEKTGCPIVPMAITNSADILENHFPKVKPTHVILQYGTPIYLDQLSADDRKHLAAYTQNTVHELLADNRKYL